MMRIAISTDGKYVSPHFGRCPTYTLVDLDNGMVTGMVQVDNPGHSPGSIPRFLHSKGVKAIVSGGMGIRAQGFFDELGIRPIMGVEGSIEEVVEKLKKGVLKGGTSLCTPGGGKGYGLDKDQCDHTHED